MIERTQKFAITVFPKGPEYVKLAGALGKSALKHPEKLAEIPYTIQANGYVTLDAMLSWVACEVRQTVATGDSTVVIAEVVDVGILNEGEPLTMKEAGFRHAG